MVVFVSQLHFDIFFLQSVHLITKLFEEPCLPLFRGSRCYDMCQLPEFDVPIDLSFFLCHSPVL